MAEAKLLMRLRMRTRLSPAKLFSLALAWGLTAVTFCSAQQPPDKYCPMLPATPQTPGHPHPQPRPKPSSLALATDGNGVTVAKIATSTGCFAESNPFLNPPGTNFLPTIYTNAYDGNGNEMPNTLPSTPANPYNLHDGPPVVKRICSKLGENDCVGNGGRTSPTDDLLEIIESVTNLSKGLVKLPSGTTNKTKVIVDALQRGIDVLEGNPVPDRMYSGLSLLHYKGPEKVKRVIAKRDSQGNVIGGNVDIHQAWFDSHIESDTAFIDPTDVLDVPWTITYTVDVLNRGHDDFAPFVMYYDDPALTAPNPPLPHIAMDQSYYNMEEGTRTVFKIKMTPGKYYSLTYTWGWRVHPPRVQVTENATKKVGGKTLVEWETSVFGERPSSNKEEAIAKIGDLAPAKRMWTAFRLAKKAAAKGDFETVANRIGDAQVAFRDWIDRTRLPKGMKTDPNSDLTLFYVNNTIYAEFNDGSRSDFPKWSVRGTTLKVSLYNGDYFEHGYQNVDFGGARGWENQFKSSVRFGGSGCWFTFGRVHWWMNIPMTDAEGKPFMVMVPPATKAADGSTKDVVGQYKVEITYNYDPSRRLRFYQFDPVHHDEAVFSIH
jgi:hypothetical protein